MTGASEGQPFKLSARFDLDDISGDFYSALLLELQRTNPRIRNSIDLDGDMNRTPLLSEVMLYDHVIINGHRYVASARSSTARNSMVEVEEINGSESVTWVGCLDHIVRVEQPTISHSTLLAVRRYVQAEVTSDFRDIWPHR